MNGSKLCTIEQIGQFMVANTDIGFSVHGDDVERYVHIRRVLKRFDDPHRSRRDPVLFATPVVTVERRRD